MMESWYGLLGAGCIITSVFLVLMVRPTLSQAVENPSISSCIPCSLLVLGTHCLSSAKRKSLITVQVSFTFVTTCRRLRLNSFPSDLCLILMPCSVAISGCTCQHSREHQAEECRGKDTTLHDTAGDWEGFWRLTIIKNSGLHAFIELANDGDEFVGAAKLAHDFPQSVSADCVEGIGEIHKGGERSQCCSIHFSWRWRAVNNMSTVPWPARKKHWLSGRRPYSRWWRRRLSSTRAKTLPAMERREIPRWLSQECRFPLLW